jgi:hypothetical protein
MEAFSQNFPLPTGQKKLHILFAEAIPNILG